MQFSSVSELLYMGGHGIYVWLAFGLSFLVLATLLVLPALKTKQLKKRLQKAKRWQQLQASSENGQPL